VAAIAVQQEGALQLQRFCVKFFARPPVDLDGDEFIGIFHEWIRRRVLPGIPIDVTDYRHVPEGPGVVLITHDANIAMDRADGRLGLLYQRKTAQPGTLSERVLAAVAEALTACRRLQQEPALDGKLAFGGEQFDFIANDRLRVDAHNGPAVEIVRAQLAIVAGRLYAPGGFETYYESSSPRERLRLRVRSSTAADVATVLENVQRRPH
jgi:hypothetical protein